MTALTHRLFRLRLAAMLRRDALELRCHAVDSHRALLLAQSAYVDHRRSLGASARIAARRQVVGLARDADRAQQAYAEAEWRRTVFCETPGRN